VKHIITIKPKATKKKAKERKKPKKFVGWNKSLKLAVLKQKIERKKMNEFPATNVCLNKQVQTEAGQQKAHDRERPQKAKRNSATQNITVCVNKEEERERERKIRKRQL
jgi:hypothetical protein